MNNSKQQNSKRLMMMLTGAFAIFFTGFPHIWSVYQPYVMQEAGWSQTQASMCFYVSLVTFVIGNILGGRMQNKRSPRLVLFIGGGLFTAGILLSALFIQKSPVPMYFSYGVLQGIGQGMIYTTILPTAQKWFPDRTGFASGIIITANGLCGFFLAPISRALLANGSASKAFLIVGSVIGVSWILSTVFFATPEEQTHASAAADVPQTFTTKQYTSGEMVQTKEFWFLLATMLFGLISYFLISPISQTYQIEQGISPSVAISAVMIGSIVNAGARLILPTVADKVGRAACVRVALITAVIAMLMMRFAGSWAVTVAVILIYGCYGGIMGSFPSFTSSIFGIKHSGENYGFVMCAIVIGSLGSPFVTNLFSSPESGMKPVFLAGAVCAAIALLCLTLLQKQLKRRELKTE